MPDTVVALKSIGEAAALVGRDGEGSIDTTVNPPVLKGKFRLRLRFLGKDYTSNPEIFGPGGYPANARAANGGWELSNLPVITMSFAAQVRVRQLPRDPLLTFSNIVVKQDAADGAPAILSLQDMSLSLAPNHDPSGIRKIVYPAAAGWKESALTSLSHPASPQDKGFFVQRLSNQGIAVVSGGAPGGIKLDHAQAMAILAGSGCSFAFQLTDHASSSQGAMHYRPKSATDLTVEVLATTGLMLQRGKPTIGVSRRSLSALQARGGLLTASIFRDEQLVLRRSTTPLHAGALAAADTSETMLFAAAENFSLNIEIPENSVFDPSVHRAEFRFEDQTAISANLNSAADPWRRFYGLRVAGVSSNRGRQEIFDVSLAKVRLRPGKDGGGHQFHFEAGGAIDGEKIPSIVIPKPDPAFDGSRTATVSTSALSLRIGASSGLLRTAPEGSLVLRTETNTLDLIRPELVGPPVGHAATGEPVSTLVRTADVNGPTSTGARFSEWLLNLPSEIDQKLTLAVDDSKAQLPPRWVEPFVTVSRQFELLEQPGAGIKLIGKSASDSAPATFPDGTKSELKVEHATGKEVLVYSAVVLAASLYPFRQALLQKLEEFRKEGEAFLDAMRARVNYRFASMSPADLDKYVRSREVDRLQFGFFSAGAGDAANPFINQFIDDNLAETELAHPPSPGDKPVGMYYMPFDVGLSVILFDYGGVEPPPNPLPRRYAYEIMQARMEPGGTIKSGMLFNFSKKEAADPALLGWTDADWVQFAHDQPSLWPRKRVGAAGARLDPSAVGWMGIMLRDLPVAFVIPPEIREAIKEKSPIAAKFIEVLNSNLQIRYGWMDSSGPTWYVTLANPAGYDFTPDDWKDFLKFELKRVGIAGAGGKPAGAEGTLSLALNRIKDSQGQPLTVVGRFGLDVTQPNPVTYIELSIDNANVLTTTAIPGFDSVKITGLSTDFVKATIKLELVPSAGLAAALPIFRNGAPTPASLVINLGGKPQSDVQLSIQTDKDTNLFGRYPLTIQGIYLQFGVKDEDANNKVLNPGRLGLGLPGLEAIGADVILRQKGGTWDFDVYINEIDVALSLGDNFKLRGLLSWAPDNVDISDLRKPGGFKQPLDGPQLPTSKDARDFWGILSLKTDSFIGDLDLLIKIGTHGERTYWVGAARSSAVIRLGHAKLESPAIVFAHNADQTGKGGLRKFITNPNANQVGGIRPPDGDLNDEKKDFEEKRNWLKSWSASDDIGNVISGSGYLHFCDTVAESPKADEGGGVPDEKLKYLTALVASDSGLFRLDAQTKFMKSAIIGFGVAIDTKNKRIMAAIRAPEISVPDKNQPKYTISPGAMSIQLSYDPAKIFFGIGIGWPPLLEGSDTERDWSQSTKVYIAELVPINTFWGGFRAELDAANHVVKFGYAVRAGWTWKAEMNGADIAKASAELGITLGGVFEFTIDFSEDASGDSSLMMPVFKRLTKIPHPLSPVVAAAYRPLMMMPHLAPRLQSAEEASIFQALDIMAEVTALDFPDIEVVATLYGDIWGKGSVEFLGVTLASIDIALRLRLQVCGGSRRGITRVYGHGEIEVRVTILCVSYTGHAGFDLWIKRGDCKHIDAMALLAPLPTHALADLPAPALRNVTEALPHE